MKTIKLTEHQLRDIIRRNLIQEANENVIEPNKAWLQRKYDEFNASIFENQLPKCTIAVSSLPDNMLGRFSVSKTALRNSMLGMGIPIVVMAGSYQRINRQTYYGLMKPKITINSKYARNEKDMENTLIHEMCHYYTCFDENGEARLIDNINEGHGPDFQRACQLVASKTNGEVNIKQLEDSEKMDTMSATQTYNKQGFNIYRFDWNGQPVFFYTKDTSLVDDYKRIFKWNIEVTSNPTLLMLLKRYRYSTTTNRTFMTKALINAYPIDDAPDIIKQTMEESEWQTY